MKKATIARMLVPAIAGLIGAALLLSSGNFYHGTALAGPGPVTVLPGDGVSFSQVDFTWPGAITLDSDTGQVDVDIAALKASTGISSGYVNIETSLGWVVQNLPVVKSFPYPSISTNFDLGSTIGDDVTIADAFVEFSPDPVTSFAGGSFAIFAVYDTEFNGEGFESTVLGGSPAPPSAESVAFEAGGYMQLSFQAGHQNVETANNQCAPAAVANSLQWLEDTYVGVNVPHNNVPGLRGGPANSLVGQLDLTMGRGNAGTTRQAGPMLGANPILKGKLTYLANNGLANVLNVKHQGMLGGGNVAVTKDGPDNLPGTPDDITMTSVGQGALVTAAFIISELKDGEDLELGYLNPNPPGGGHFVEIVGAGTILGIPWITYKSDHVQSSTDAKVPPDAIDNNEGTGRTDFSFLLDTPDAGASPNLVNEKAVPDAAFLISQSPKPGFDRPVGGIAELPDVDGTPLDASESSGPGTGVLAGVAGVVVAGAVTLGGAAWYVRRRRVR